MCGQRRAVLYCIRHRYSPALRCSFCRRQPHSWQRRYQPNPNRESAHTATTTTTTTTITTTTTATTTMTDPGPPGPHWHDDHDDQDDQDDQDQEHHHDDHDNQGNCDHQDTPVPGGPRRPPGPPPPQGMDIRCPELPKPRASTVPRLTNVNFDNARFEAYLKQSAALAAWLCLGDFLRLLASGLKVSGGEAF